MYQQQRVVYLMKVEVDMSSKDDLREVSYCVKKIHDLVRKYGGELSIEIGGDDSIYITYKNDEGYTVGEGWHHEHQEVEEIGDFLAWDTCE